MKNFFKLLLAVVFLVACNDERCLVTFSEEWSEAILPDWDKQTHANVVHQKNDTLLSIFTSAAKEKISLFERESFLKEISKLPNLNKYTFDSLIVIEINSSGERNMRVKYLLPYCQQKGSLIKFELNQGGWEFIWSHKIEANKLSVAVNALMAESNKKSDWGAYNSGLTVISKFASHTKTSVKVSDSLSEMQGNALSNLIQ